MDETSPATLSDGERLALLRLTLTPGLGPVLIARSLARFGTAEEASRASPAAWAQIEGIGAAKSAAIAAGLEGSKALADAELDLVRKAGADLAFKGDIDYPPLLAELPDAPPMLYILGRPEWGRADRFPVAIVGSRDCTHYGQEQARRFAGSLAQAGLTIVSGGARGIDAAAHHGALVAGGRTVAVLGCGLNHLYPPENAELFARVRGAGAIVSELPMSTPPAQHNFPSRNRIISGLSLGVVVVEAGEKSGALITARVAAEDHGREVLAVPGRVDSPASRGTLALLKSGGAAMATEPADVLGVIEAAAHHLHRGTHGVRFPAHEAAPDLFAVPPPAPSRPKPVDPAHAAILEALADPMGVDDLCERVGLPVARVRTELTLLEMQGRVRRVGSKFCAGK